MENQDIRWEQRFEYFIGVYEDLKEAFAIFKLRSLTRL